jgi:hypothetical protein
MMEMKCHILLAGKFVSDSCVFGMDDVPFLVKRPELVVHKMYLDFEPAG